jgi:hypothetical protein
LSTKSSSVVYKAWTKITHKIQALTDPGGRDNYRIELYRHDPGTEFKGAFEEKVGRDNIINVITEAKRHSANMLVEGFNGLQQRRAAAIGATACGDNIEVLTALRGELLNHATFLRRMDSITDRQKTEGISAYQDQTGRKVNLGDYELYTVGSLAYGYVNVEYRTSKVSPRAVKGVWVGVNDDLQNAHRIVPFRSVGGKEGHWEFSPTITCLRADVFEGVMPLYPDYVEGEIAKPSEEWATAEDIAHAADAEPEDEEKEPDGYIINCVIDRNPDCGPADEYCVTYEGWDDSQCLWFPKDALIADGYQHLIDAFEAGSTGSSVAGTETVIAAKTETTETDHETTVKPKAIPADVYTGPHTRSRVGGVLPNDGKEQLAKFLGPQLGARIVAVVELKPRELFSGDLAEKAIAARDKEKDAMMDKRFTPAPDATEAQKKNALACRYSFTQKRPTQEQIALNEEGTIKARIVAKQLKCIYQLAHAVVHADVPGISAVRLVLALIDLNKHRISTNDYVTAFLQAHGYPEGVRVLVCLPDPVTGELEYFWCSGVIYGMQDAAKAWKDTVGTHLGTIGFVELKNAPSIYVNASRRIIMCCHVDDPMVISESAEDEEWIHDEINSEFETNGINRLTPWTPIDYLSMRLTVDEKNVLRVDNSAKITKFLTDAGMENCNPSEVPLTSDRLITCLKDATPLNAQQVTEYQAHIGKYNWLVATTHATLATVTSILASY